MEILRKATGRSASHLGSSLPLGTRLVSILEVSFFITFLQAWWRMREIGGRGFMGDAADGRKTKIPSIPLFFFLQCVSIGFFLLFCMGFVDTE